MLVSAPVGWPVLTEVSKAFFCMQDPGSYSVVPSHHMNKFTVCQNTPKKSPNFDFLGVHKILSFLFEANFDPKKKLPLGILSEQCGSKTRVLLYINLISTCTSSSFVKIFKIEILFS